MRYKNGAKPKKDVNEEEWSKAKERREWRRMDKQDDCLKLHIGYENEAK